MSHISRRPVRWARPEYEELRIQCELTPEQVIARATRRRERALREFTHEEIGRWGLDNPFAAGHALRTMAAAARREGVNRRDGLTAPKISWACAHLGPKRKPVTAKPPKAQPQRWPDAPEVVVAKPVSVPAQQPREERKAA